MAGWRYIARRLNGDGTESGIGNDLPLGGVLFRGDLSGPGGIDCVVSPEVSRLKGPDGRPVFLPWHTAIYAEKDGLIREGALLYDMSEDGPNLRLDTVGWTGYAKDTEFDGEIIETEVDPMDMYRAGWDNIQARPGRNIGLVVEGTKSPVRIGQGPDAEPFGTNSGPYRLAWFQNHDLASDLDQLAADTPFEYRVEHSWVGDSEEISHRLLLGYPQLGSRRHDLRFVVGENVSVVPPVEYDGDRYASEVLVLGAGEGRDMIRGRAVRDTGRLGRTAVVTDKNLRSNKEATARAERELAMRMGSPDITEVVVRDHRNARYGTYFEGDEILVQTDEGWTGKLALWARIISRTYNPESGEATLTLLRAEKV